MAGRRSRDTSCCLTVCFCSAPPGSECLEFALWGRGGGGRKGEGEGSGAGGSVPPPEKKGTNLEEQGSACET